MNFQTLMVLPIGKNVFLTKISLGLIYLLKKNKFKVVFFKPVIFLSKEKRKFFSSDINNVIDNTQVIRKINSIFIKDVDYIKDKQQYLQVLDTIIVKCYKYKKMYDLIIIEGIDSNFNDHVVDQLNFDIAKNLNSKIIFVTSVFNNDTFLYKKILLSLWKQHLENRYKYTIGIILNKIHILHNSNDKNFFLKNLKPFQLHTKNVFCTTSFEKKNVIKGVPILGCISWKDNFKSVSVIEIMKYLKATVIYLEKCCINQVKFFSVLNGSQKYISRNYYKDSLLIISNVTLSKITKLFLEISKGVQIGSILILGSNGFAEDILYMVKKLRLMNTSVFFINSDIIKIVQLLQKFTIQSSNLNINQMKRLQIYVIDSIDTTIIIDKLVNCHEKNHFLAPEYFKYYLRTLASKLCKNIIFPEGDDIRILKSVSICEQYKIAKCILLGNPSKIYNIAQKNNINLGKNIEIIDPNLIRNNYISYLIKKRLSKGITLNQAKLSLKDNMVLSTLMLSQNEVDGIVSGIRNTTANTVRPALQLVKVQNDYSIVSSVFFMLLPEKVVLFADCAINIEPNASELAEIVIQTSDTAIFFGIKPIVAMLSYATGDSSKGISVDKINLSINIVKSKRSDIIIDGPIQYDAAIDEKIGHLKAPQSLVAGKANIFIFPDLNSGNIVYKAVQRSAKISSIGPILQGISKPVNDLSRGSSIDDIVYTIAVTGIQSLSVLQKK